MRACCRVRVCDAQASKYLGIDATLYSLPEQARILVETLGVDDGD